MENPLQSINMKVGITSSVVLHLFIILILYFIHTELDIPSVEFAEMSFVASSTQDFPMTIEEPTKEEQVLADQMQFDKIETSPQTLEPVNMPKIRSFDDDEK